MSKKEREPQQRVWEHKTVREKSGHTLCILVSNRMGSQQTVLHSMRMRYAEKGKLLPSIYIPSRRQADQEFSAKDSSSE